MKKLLPLLCLLLCLLLLCGCTQQSPADEPPPTVPLHSDLYLPGLEVDEVLTYFNEVCLDAEITNSGDPSRLQKWDAPLRYTLLGQPTARDRSNAEEFARWLNTIEGFPGMAETTDANAANLTIHFCPEDEMIALMGDWAAGLDGAVTFWYENDAIYQAVICCRSDIDQDIRSSVLLEELYNGLGPVQDTALRPDSIIYAEYSTPQRLSDVDELLLRLLYHPTLQPGMDRAACSEAIQQLYQ